MTARIPFIPGKTRGHRPRLQMGVYQLSSRIKNRVAPPETAPKVAPFLPPMAAPIAVAMPAVAAIRRVSLSQDRRFPPPHNTIAVFICTSKKKFPVPQARHVPHGGCEHASAFLTDSADTVSTAGRNAHAAIYLALRDRNFSRKKASPSVIPVRH